MKERGFTVIELVVVITIIFILTSVGLFSYNEASKSSRDKDRQADLRTLQAAVEQYKSKYGRYPARCTNANAVTAGNWSGQEGTNFACIIGQQYIIGLAPEFIPALPYERVLNGTNSGYVYTTNAEGTVYKLMARRTVETQSVNYAHPLKSCDATDSGTGICDATDPTFNKPDWCQEYNTTFQTSYGVWGGYAQGANNTVVERLTEDIICDIP